MIGKPRLKMANDKWYCFSGTPSTYRCGTGDTKALAYLDWTYRVLNPPLIMECAPIDPVTWAKL